MKSALITGVTGQDGSHLSDILLSKGYRVIGMSRRRSGGGDWRIQHLYDNENFILEFGDVTDSGSLRKIVSEYKPDECYNLAAQSYVGLSWREPAHTFAVTAGGVINLLEVLHAADYKCKMYQASSSEQFGKVQETPQRESTTFYPRSPYGISKVAGYWATVNYRESYNMFCCNGILFNHEGPRRGLEFVTRKITNAAARIKLSGGGLLRLGNLDSKRDWGAAVDYMEAAWLILQQDEPDDFVISTGKLHSIRDLLDVAFSYVGLNWEDHVVQDEKFIRPAEVDLLLGDSSKAKEKLNWTPTIGFEQMIGEMVNADLQRLRKV